MNFINSSLFKEKYDFIFSIGEACSCSIVLRNSGLQCRSMPFDWVAWPNLIERSKMFQNNFCDWLPKDALQHIGEQLIEKVPKNVYKNTKTGTIFNHDFPLNQSLDESYPTVKDKYNRRIARLYKMIRSSKTVLAVNLAIPQSTLNYTTEQLIQVKNTLSECFPDVNIHLLHVSNDNDIPLRHAEVTSPAPGVFKTSFCYKAFNKENSYAVNNKILNRFFVHIKLSNKHLSWMDRLNKWSAQHPFLNHIVRWRVRLDNMQTFEIFRMRVYSRKVKNY